MFILAATLLTVTTFLGAGLIALLQATDSVGRVAGRVAGRVWPLRVAHGGLGVIGYATLVVAWAVAPRADPARFGTMALIALTIAVAGGLAVFIGRFRRREAPIVVLALHATLGAAGVVMLAAYLA
jgi:hypothetical protein